MPAVSSSVTTIAELLALPEDGMRHELLDGVHAVTPSPALLHQLVWDLPVDSGRLSIDLPSLFEKVLGP